MLLYAIPYYCVVDLLPTSVLLLYFRPIPRKSKPPPHMPTAGGRLLAGAADDAGGSLAFDGGGHRGPGGPAAAVVSAGATVQGSAVGAAAALPAFDPFQSSYSLG
eukprot:SAG22_NODE_58_length_23645_cov_16.637943_17_plen_105_part_00